MTGPSHIFVSLVYFSSINAIREICLRCPLAMSEDLLKDLANYKRYRMRPVQLAATALVALFRELNRKMLMRRDRVSNTI